MISKDIRDEMKVKKQITKIKDDRILKIYANETFVILNDNARIVLHLIPLSAISSEKMYDTNELQNIKPFIDSSTMIHKKAEGLIYSKSEMDSKSEKTGYDYMKLFENGVLEAVDNSWLKRSDSKIPSILFEGKTMEAFTNYISNLENIGVETPIFAFLTLVGIKGFSMSLDESYRYKGHMIEKYILPIPKIIVKNFNFEAEKLLKPWFDNVWNECGFQRSYNFDDSGKWTGKSNEYNRNKH